jgi:hypothetical protein
VDDVVEVEGGWRFVEDEFTRHGGPFGWLRFSVRRRLVRGTAGG